MNISAIYLFGAPRALSPDASGYAESLLPLGRIFRHVHQADIIPNLPFKIYRDPRQGPLEVYDHVGLVAVFPTPEHLFFGPHAWARTKKDQRLNAKRFGLPRREAAAAHRLESYSGLVYEQYRQDPNPRFNGWNPAIALACIRASRLAHQGNIQSVLSYLGFQQKIRRVVGSGVEVLVTIPRHRPTNAHAIVAFQGTWPADLTSFQHWRQAVQTWQSPPMVEREPWYPGAPGLANVGWLRQVLEIEATLNDTLDRFVGDLPIIVTGHSTGGAHGLLWALRQLEAGREGPDSE